MAGQTPFGRPVCAAEVLAAVGEVCRAADVVPTQVIAGLAAA